MNIGNSQTPPLVSGELRYLFGIKSDDPGTNVDQSHNGFQGARFANPVPADDTHDLFFLNGHRKIEEDLAGAITGVEVFKVEHLSNLSQIDLLDELVLPDLIRSPVRNHRPPCHHDNPMGQLHDHVDPVLDKEDRFFFAHRHDNPAQFIDLFRGKTRKG